MTAWHACRQSVTVAAIYQDDEEVNAAKGGENLRLRLTGVEEEEMQAGFVVCSRHVPVPCVTHFNAQLQVHFTCFLQWVSGPRSIWRALSHLVQRPAPGASRPLLIRGQYCLRST